MDYPRVLKLLEMGLAEELLPDFTYLKKKWYGTRHTWEGAGKHSDPHSRVFGRGGGRTGSLIREAPPTLFARDREKRVPEPELSV